MSETDEAPITPEQEPARAAGPTDADRALLITLGTGNPTNERERRQVAAGRALLSALHGRRVAAASLGRAHLSGGGGKPAQDRAEATYKQAQADVDAALERLESLL
jgi:hypothetical protein